MFETLSKRGFQVEFLSHAKAILSLDFPDAALGELSILEEIIGSGGGEAKGTPTSAAIPYFSRLEQDQLYHRKADQRSSKRIPFHMKSIMSGNSRMAESSH